MLRFKNEVWYSRPILYKYYCYKTISSTDFDNIWRMLLQVSSLQCFYVFSAISSGIGEVFQVVLTYAGSKLNNDYLEWDKAWECCFRPFKLLLTKPWTWVPLTIAFLSLPYLHWWPIISGILLQTPWFSAEQSPQFYLNHTTDIQMSCLKSQWKTGWWTSSPRPVDSLKHLTVILTAHWPNCKLCVTHHFISCTHHVWWQMLANQVIPTATAGYQHLPAWKCTSCTSGQVRHFHLSFSIL